MVYEWTDRRHKVSAQIAGEVCEELGEKGMLTAGNLVDVSRPEDAPLHEEFEWDDSVAGEEWRKHQARNLINHIRVVRSDGEKKEDIRAFFTLKVTEPEYESIRVILSDDQKYLELMKLALRELMAFEKKYATIKEFAKIFEVIHEVEKEIA